MWQRLVWICSCIGGLSGLAAAPTAFASSTGGAGCLAENNGNVAYASSPVTLAASAHCSSSTVGGPVDGTAAAAVDLLHGSASVSAGSENGSYGSSARATFTIDGLVTGSGFGTLTWGDTGLIVSRVAGYADYAFAHALFSIADTSSGILSQVCYDNVQTGCSTTPSITTSAYVHGGEQLALTLQLSCDALAQNSSGASCTMSDPVTLSLTNGLGFKADFPGFLSPPANAPEPSTLALLAAAALGAVGVPRLRRRLRLSAA